MKDHHNMILFVPDLGGIAASVTAIGGFFLWLWRTSSSVAKAHVELGICKADVATLKTDTRDLHDRSIRLDVTVGSISQQIAAQNLKLDRLEDKTDAVINSVSALTASVAALTSNLERMENRT